MKFRFQVQQTLAFGFGQRGDGNAGPIGYDRSNVLGGYLASRLAAVPFRLFRIQFALKVKFSISQHGGFLEVLAANGFLFFTGCLNGLFFQCTQIGWRRQTFDANAGRGFVDQVNRLVWKITLVKIALRQRDSGLQRMICNG